MRRSESGFTLLEVLAAVALLAFFYTMLSTVAIRGLRSEGRSRHLLEASLLVDRKLAELELQLDSGTVPEIGEEEIEEDPYTIRIEVSAFSIDAPESAVPLALLPGAEVQPKAASGLLGNLDPDDSPIRQVVLTVEWPEGPDVQSTSRTTYAVDPIALQEAAAQLAGGAPGAGEGGAGAAPTGPASEPLFGIPSRGAP